MPEEIGRRGSYTEYQEPEDGYEVEAEGIEKSRFGGEGGFAIKSQELSENTGDQIEDGSLYRDCLYGGRHNKDPFEKGRSQRRGKATSKALGRKTQDLKRSSS